MLSLWAKTPAGEAGAQIFWKLSSGDADQCNKMEVRPWTGRVQTQHWPYASNSIWILVCLDNCPCKVHGLHTLCIGTSASPFKFQTLAISKTWNKGFPGHCRWCRSPWSCVYVFGAKVVGYKINVSELPGPCCLFGGVFTSLLHRYQSPFCFFRFKEPVPTAYIVCCSNN